MYIKPGFTQIGEETKLEHLLLSTPEVSVLEVGTLANAEGASVDFEKGQLLYEYEEGKFKPLAINLAEDEVLLAGDGNAHAVDKVLAHRPVILSTLSVGATVGASEITGACDGEGVISGDITGYALEMSGMVHIDSFSPDNETNVTGTYYYSEVPVAVLAEDVTVGAGSTGLARVIRKGVVNKDRLSDINADGFDADVKFWILKQLRNVGILSDVEKG